MAFTGIGTMMVAGEAASAAVVLSAVTEVGLVMSVVGAVTGNKDLIKIGGALGIVGGVGGLVNGAMSGAAAGSADAFAQSAAGGAGNAADMASGLGAGDAAASMDTAAAAAPDAAGAVATPVPDQSVLTPGAVDAPVQNTVTATPGAPAAQPVAATPDALTVQAPQAPTVADNTVVKGAAGPGDPGWGQDLGQANPLNAPVATKNYLSQFLNFAQKNDRVLAAGALLVGGAFKGAADRDMANQRIALEQQRMARANQVGNFAPTTGIINSARPA